MNIDTPIINSSDFHNSVYESITEEQMSKQHNTLNLTSAEISAIEHEIIFKKTQNKNEHSIASIDNSQFNPIDAQHLQNKDNFLIFTKTKEFNTILKDVTNDINKLTELAAPYITDKNTFKDDMAILVTKLQDIDNYQQSGVSVLIEFFRLTSVQIKTIIQLFNLITTCNTDETQKLASEDALKIILSASIEYDMNLCLAGVITKVLQLYNGLKNILEKSELITEIITNIASALAKEIIKDEITVGDKFFNEYMDIHDNNSLIKIIADDFNIDCPYDPMARDITNATKITKLKNKAEIVISPYNILLTLADEMFDRLTNIITSHDCIELFNQGIDVHQIPQGLTADIDNFFIKPLNAILSSDNSTAINITDILEVDENDTIISIKDLTAKLKFWIPQKLLGKKSKWLVGEISNKYLLSDTEHVIVAVGNSYFGVMDKKNIYTADNEFNITFNNNIPVQLEHINPELITKNSLQKTSYRPLIIEALKNTENAIEIINFFNNDEIQNILRDDLEFTAYLAEIISNKAEKNSALKENLAKLVYNKIVATNKNILTDNSSYNIFMNSTLLEPILHKLLDQKIDITDILAQLAISQIANLSQKDSLKNICDRALAAIDNADEAKQKIVANFINIHHKLMKYGHSHIIPLVISTNLINSALGIITQDNENELSICARYKNTTSINIIYQENSKRSMQNKLDINQQNNNGDTPLMISAINGDIATLAAILKNDKVNINLKKQDGFTVLMIAAEKGYAEHMEILLKYNADSNVKTNLGFTALIIAARYGHTECVKILLENKADVNLKTLFGSTALMLAAKHGYAECIEMLLKYHADINLDTNLGFTALMIAAQNGHAGCIEMLLKHHADVNLQDKYGGVTALIIAAIHGYAECIEMLLKYKADINLQSEDGSTALMLALECGYTECIKILLEHKADINLQNEYGSTALIIAANNGYAECIEILLKYHADINLQNKQGYTALMIAAEKGHTECIKILLEHKADINMQQHGFTALMIAAKNGHVECIKILLEHKADINMQQQHGLTALMYASENGKIECVKMLLNHQADVNIQDSDGYGFTALMYAAERCHTECIKLLLEKNADVNLQEKVNLYTALMMATNNGHTECMKILLEHKADINLQKRDGLTALMIAAEKGYVECMKILLEYKADINMQEKNGLNGLNNGYTALMIATQRGHAKCIEMLLKYHADINIQDSSSGYTALMLGTEMSYTECIKILLEKNADVNLQENESLYTALMIAVMNNNYVDIDSDILDDIDLVKRYNNYVTCVAVLLNHQADINIQDINGCTALMFAAQQGKTTLVEMLLNHQTDINIQDKNGYTALMIVAQNGSAECIKILLKHKADINLQNEDGFTALMIAAYEDYAKCIKILLENQADVKLINKHGDTALDIAKINKYEECIAYLESHSRKLTYKESKQDLAKTKIKK